MKITKPPSLRRVVSHLKAVRGPIIKVPTEVEGRTVDEDKKKTKICRVCFVRRPLHEFFRRRVGEPQRSSRCKKCAAEAQRDLRARRRRAKLVKAAKPDGLPK